MARKSPIVAKCSLVILAWSMIHISCRALVNHRILSARMVHRRRPSSPLQSTSRPQTSSETTFWIAIAQKNQTSSSDSIPATPHIDRETGPLPPGAYRHSSSDDGIDAIAPCRITVGITPQSNVFAGEDVLIEGVKNCQNLIDSGFNTFRVNDCHTKLENRRRRNIARRRSPLSIALEHIQQRATKTRARNEAEANFYRKLRQSTPSSVLRSCHFMVNLEIPSVLSDDFPGLENEISSVSFGNGWMVRESISSALLRTKGECLDSIVLECESLVTFFMSIPFVSMLTKYTKRPQKSLLSGCDRYSFRM
jgi:hypothetical protein